MKKITLVLLIIAALGQVASAGEFTGTFAEAKAQSAKLGKPVLVDFFTEW
jgi:hypothetical protein